MSKKPSTPSSPEYMVSLSLDVDGIRAGSAKEALNVAIEALSLGIPTLIGGVDFGPVAHVIPPEGKHVTIHIKSRKIITEEWLQEDAE